MTNSRTMLDPTMLYQLIEQLPVLNYVLLQHANSVWVSGAVHVIDIDYQWSNIPFVNHMHKPIFQIITWRKKKMIFKIFVRNIINEYRLIVVHHDCYLRQEVIFFNSFVCLFVCLFTISQNGHRPRTNLLNFGWTIHITLSVSFSASLIFTNKLNSQKTMDKSVPLFIE